MSLNLDTYSLSLITAREDILSPRSSTDWAVFTYEKKWSLKLLDSGVGGLEELLKKFNENLVQYGLCQVSDPSSGVQRIILIYWVGQNVDAFRKGVAAEHLPAIRRFFKEANVVLGAQKVEDITQEVVAQALSRVPPPARAFQKTRVPGSSEVVGTKYMKTNPAVEMKISKREAFWQRSEREEERRKEAERLRLQEERINLERERIQRERQEEEERDRRIQEKERMVEEQRKEQARIDAERRRLEKERWAQQQREFEEEMRGRIRRSQSIEMAAEAAALVSGRSLHPRDFFRQQERSVSTSFSPPSTPSSPSKSSGFFNRPTPRYQRSVTESILTPPSRSPTFFQGYQRRDSFRSVSPSMPQQCSPAFIFSKSPLPGMSPKVDSLPSFIPPPITATRVTPTQVKASSPQSHHTAPKTATNDVPFRAEYVTVSPAEPSAAASNINTQTRPQHEDPQPDDVFRAELVPVVSPSPPKSEVKELPNKAAISPTAIKATVSVSSPVTEMALTSPAPIPEAKTPASPQRTETVVPAPSPALGGTQRTETVVPAPSPALGGPQRTETVAPAPSPALGGTQPTTTSLAQVTTPTPTAQISKSSALPTNKTTVINETAPSTNSALSYEPKVSPVPSSLVSLLAPIPYTPYRTQRADSITSRSSFSAAPLAETPSVVSPGSLNREASLSSAVEFSKILEAKYPPPGEFTQTSSTSAPPVPVSVRLLNSSPVYQPTLVQATETSPVFRPITSENSFMPQPSSTPQEVQPIDPIPESAFLPIYVPAKSHPSYNQVDIPDALVPSVQSSSVFQSDDIHTSSGLFNGNSQESEPNNNQTEVLSPARTLDAQPNNISDSLLPQLSPVSPSIPLNLTELQPSKVQADILPGESSPGVLSLGTKTSSESPINANNGDVPLPSPISPLLPNGSLAESHPNIQTNVLTQNTTSSSSSTIPTETSAELQKNTFQADVRLPEPLPTSPSLPNESYTGPPLNNIQADIPLVQPSPEPPSITTERSGSQLNVKADIPFIESLSEPPSITPKDSSTQQLSNVQADIPLVEPSPICSTITSESLAKPLPNSLLANIPLVEPLREPPSITTEISSGLQLDAQANYLIIESASESPSITLKGSSEPERHSIQANILLPEPLTGSSSLPPGRSTEPQSIKDSQADSLPEPPSITTEGWSEPQLNTVQGDIPSLEPPSVSSSFLTESLSAPQTNDSQAESLPEPPSNTTEGWSGPQLNIVQGDIPSQEPPSVSSSFVKESSSEPQTNYTQAKSLSEHPSITTEGWSGPQLNTVQGEIPFIELPSQSPSLESSNGPQSNNTPDESLLEPPSITTKALAGQADIPFVQPLPVSSSLLTEGSSGFQSNIKAESLPEPPSITTEALSGTQLNIVQENIPFITPPSVSSSIPDGHLSGPQANITQAEVLPEPPPITSEGSSEHQPNIVQDIPLIEPLSISSSLFMESSSGPQLNSNQAESLPEQSSFTTTDSFEPQPHDTQADIPLLESRVPTSIPTESSAKSQISDNGEGVFLQEISAKSASHESSEEAQENDIHANTQSSGLFLPTEISTGPHNEQVQPIALSMESSLISPAPQTTSPSKPCPNILVDIPLTGSSSASSSLPTKSSSESQLNDIQTNLKSIELLALSSSLPTDGFFESQPNDIQTITQSAEVLPISSSLSTDGSSESQPNDIQTITQSAEVLPISSSLSTDGSSEPKSSDIPTNVQSGELLSMSSSLPPEGSSKSQPNDIAELLPISSIQPTELSSDFSPSNIQSDLKSAVPLPVSLSESKAELHQNDIHPYNELENSSCPPTEVSTESQLVPGDISLQESVLTSSNLPIVPSPESQPSGYRSDGQSLESTAASLGPLSNPKADDDQPYNLVQESSPGPTSVPIYGSSEPQLNNTEADIPPQEPPPAPPVEAQPENIQTDLLLTESSPIEESSPITTIYSSGPLPHKAQEEISLIETLPVSLPPSTDSQPYITNGTPSLSEESLPITIQSEEPLTESSFSTLPPNSTSYNGGKPNEVLSDDVLPLPIPLLEEVPLDQSLPSTLPFDSSPEFPLRSPSPQCEIVYAEKVLLVEDPHPGSPPINENFIALESVPTITGELEATFGGLQPAENILVHDVLSSNNITVDEDSASVPKLVSEGDQLLHQQLNSNSSEALL